MAIREALLALLEWGPSTAYQLKHGFERTTSQIWPLNMGQVSTTLQRLCRDGLIAEQEERHDDAVIWELTNAGRQEACAWWMTPVTPEQRGRDELVMKLAFAVVTPGVDLDRLIERQRVCLQQLLHDVTRAKRLTAPDDIAARLVLDHRIYATEAELRWLDTLDDALVRAVATRRNIGGGRATVSSGTGASRPEHYDAPLECAPVSAPI